MSSSGFPRRLPRLIAVLGLPSFLLSCSLNADFIDLSVVDISFKSPARNKFTNQASFDFQIEFSSNNPRLSAEKAFMEFYEGEDCDPEKKISSRRLRNDGLATTSTTLEDGKKYSARVFVPHEDKVFRSVCSPWLGVDHQSPHPVSVQYPSNDTYVSSKQFLAAWSTSADNGISGLREEPYRLRLYGQPACSGEVRQMADSKVEQFTFENLTHGVTYSVQVSAVDNAGNESPLSCSPYTEIDIYAPGFRLQDPSSIEGYSRVSAPEILIENDPQAGYWCITPDTAFFPTSFTEPCPGGHGGANGWHTARPGTLPLSAGDGLKTYNLWLFRSNDTLLSNKETSAAIRLDQTPPGSFGVVGIGNSRDQVFDGWLTALGETRVKWLASEDAVDYNLEIRDGDDKLVCRREGLPADATEHTFADGECGPFLNDESYEIRMTSFDVARNPTSAPSFTFTVDLVPPGDFSILGVAGGPDLDVDSFFGTGAPNLRFENSAGATHYEVEVRDADDAPVCGPGTKSAPTTLFDFALEGGASCSLSHGKTYQAMVTALDDGKSRTPALNSPFHFRVDTEAPIVNFTAAPENITVETSAEIAFTAEDLLSGVRDVLCAFDGGPDTACASPRLLTALPEGPHQLSVTAIDKAGNPKTETHSWFVDLTGPVTTILSGPSGARQENSASFSFTAVDVGPAGVGRFECSLNGSGFTECASPAVYPALSEGPQTFSVRSVDALGNSGAPVSGSFLTDYTAPSLSITSAPANPTDHTTSASLTFVHSDAGSGIASVRCQLDGAGFTDCTSPVSYSGLGPGSHTVTIRVEDQAGQVTVLAHTWTIHTYSWSAGAWGTCSAAQPSWSAAAWSACSAPQPAYVYSGWGSCSATCGGGVQYRTQSCPITSGTQTRAVSCPTTTGAQTRAVTCLRNDGTAVTDGKCLAAKPATTQACSRNDCAGAAPSTSQACNRGGASDCHSAQATSRACNTQPCCGGATVGGYCWYLGAQGQSCTTVCASRGGYHDATRTYAGNLGSNANCQAVFAALGRTGATNSYGDCNSGSEYLGCFVKGAPGSNMRCTNATTTESHSGSWASRVCACNN